jgi:hypothetical protein
MATIEVDGITIEVQRKKMKNMTLRVCAPEGTVKLSAPLRSSDTVIRRFAATHIVWIQKHQLAYQSEHHVQSYAYITGERHFLQGREYLLRVHERMGKPQFLMTQDTYIDLYVPYGATVEQRKKLLMKGYRDILQAQLEILIPYWENIIGVSASQYQIRSMKTRWGSCHPQTRKICLNLELIKYPSICLDYVIVHEIVHLLEASHNARFKSLMDKFMPDWRVHRARLHEPIGEAEHHRIHDGA